MQYIHSAICRAREERDEQRGKGDRAHDLTCEKEVEERLVFDGAELCAAKKCGSNPNVNDEKCQKCRAPKETGIGFNEIFSV